MKYRHGSVSILLTARRIKKPKTKQRSCYVTSSNALIGYLILQYDLRYTGIQFVQMLRNFTVIFNFYYKKQEIRMRPWAGGSYKL